MEVKPYAGILSKLEVVTTLLQEYSAVTDYHTLRDSLPGRLSSLLCCRCVLLYQRVGTTLQFAAGTFDDQPGWSAALLAVAHINPVSFDDDLPEARAWRERRTVLWPITNSTGIAVPLVYRQHTIGVLALLRSCASTPSCWQPDELPLVESVAGIAALLLENTRLLERDRARIHKLSLLNSISSQINYALYEEERIYTLAIQYVREITGAEQCVFIDARSEAVGAEMGWITPTLRSLLLQHYQKQRSPVPLVIERSGKESCEWTQECFVQLPAQVKTFFLLPLISGVHNHDGQHDCTLVRSLLGERREPHLVGLVAGAFHRPRTIRNEELLVLQVLANQSSAVLENIRLMAEVVEARNEARKLLRQVLDDRRLKALIVQSIPSGLLTTDRRGCITTCNRAAEQIFGYDAGEVIGQPLQTLLDARHVTGAASFAIDAPVESSALIVRQGHISHATVETCDRHKEPLVLDITAQPLYGEHGEQVGMLITFSDVTSVHRLEEEKRRLDRLAALGEMAASVAHEVRNPLASIKTSIQIALDDLAMNEPMATVQRTDDAQTEPENRLEIREVQESMTIVLHEVERLDTIVHDLLLFARPRRLHRRACDIVALCEHVLHMIQVQCTKSGIIVQRAYDDVPELWVDMAQMEQILLNLCMNAMQAMSEGGLLTIACHRYILDDGCQSRLQGQAWIELLISDTGSGIKPEEQERIFQPFFTTKAHGIGLGLPISRRFIEDHGGSIHVESHPGRGSTFAIRLPISVGNEKRQALSEER